MLLLMNFIYIYVCIYIYTYIYTLGERLLFKSVRKFSYVKRSCVINLTGVVKKYGTLKVEKHTVKVEREKD